MLNLIYKSRLLYFFFFLKYYRLDIIIAQLNSQRYIINNNKSYVCNATHTQKY